MRRFCLAILTMVVFSAPGAGSGEVVEIPLELPDTPLYVRGGDRFEVGFDAGRPLSGATGVAVRLAGSGWFARSICWQFGNYGGGVWSHREDVGATASLLAAGEPVTDATLVLAAGDHPDLETIDFDAALALTAVDWSFLADGTGTVVLQGLDCAHFAVYPEVCICDMSAALTGVSLLVALDGEVPVGKATWGAFKARYR